MQYKLYDSNKRIKGNTYVFCFCDKHSEVLVGAVMYKYLNPFAWLFGVTISILFLFSGVDIVSTLYVVVLLGLPAIFLPLYSYKDAKKTMLELEHSDNCSRKIAYMVMFRSSLWSEFKIMDNNQEKKEMDLDTWKDNIVDVIRDIADKEKQEESWPVGRDDILSIIEIYERLLDDFMFEEFLAVKDNGFTDLQVKLGKQLMEALDEYSPPGKGLPDEVYMLNDPRWRNVRFAATEFLKSLKRRG